MGGGVRFDDEAGFRLAREIIMRVHQRIGLPIKYTRSDFQRNDRLIRDRSRAMRERQRQEAARIAMFEGWEHGGKLDELVRSTA